MPHPQLRFALSLSRTQSQEPMTEPYIKLPQTNQNIDPAITSFFFSFRFYFYLTFFTPLKIVARELPAKTTFWSEIPLSKAEPANKDGNTNLLWHRRRFTKRNFFI